MADTLDTGVATLDKERAHRIMEPHFNREEGETFDLYPGIPGYGLTGYVVRTAFRDVPSIERLEWVDEFIARTFGDEADQIGLVLTFTPEEFDGYLEDMAF